MITQALPRALTDAARRTILEVLIDQVRRECRAELVNNHPGARHRVAQLLTIGARIAGQIEVAEVGS